MTLDQKRAARRDYMRKWRAKNTENAEKHRRWSQRWRDEHRDQYRAYSRTWYAGNRKRPRPPVDLVKARLRNRKYRAAHPEVQRAYQAANLEKWAALNHRRRARSRDTDLTASDLKQMRAAATRCPLCCIDLRDYSGRQWRADRRHVDHIVPLCSGGLHIRGNVRIVCADCNLHRPKDGSDVKELCVDN